MTDRRREDILLSELAGKLAMHEAICVERYEAICKTAEATQAGLSELKGLVMKVATYLITGMVGIIGVLVWKVLGL